MNPFGRVPVLKDGDTIIRDSQAILVYLARQYGDERWLPPDAAALAQVTAWLFTAANDSLSGTNRNTRLIRPPMISKNIPIFLRALLNLTVSVMCIIRWSWVSLETFQAWLIFNIG